MEIDIWHRSNKGYEQHRREFMYPPNLETRGGHIVGSGGQRRNRSMRAPPAGEKTKLDRPPAAQPEVAQVVVVAVL